MLKYFIYFLVSASLFAGKPSWKTYAVFIDGVKTEEEAKAVQKAIIATDLKMVKEVKGLTAKSGYALIHHDHHNITIQKIAQNILNKGEYKVYTKLSIPDYKKVQGSIIGNKLNELISQKGRGYKIVAIDKEKGLFEVIILKGKHTGKGFNFGDLAHPISDPIVFGGLGLNMQFIGAGEKNAGAMIKDVTKKEIAFRKSGKKMKKYSPELMAEYKKLFDFPGEKLKQFYK